MRLGIFNKGRENSTLEVIWSLLSWHSGCSRRFQAKPLPAQYLKKINYRATLLPQYLFYLENLSGDYWLFVMCPAAYIWGLNCEGLGSVAGSTTVESMSEHSEVNLEVKRTLNLHFVDLLLFSFLSNSCRISFLETATQLLFSIFIVSCSLVDSPKNNTVKWTLKKYV